MMLSFLSSLLSPFKLKASSFPPSSPSRLKSSSATSSQSSSTLRGRTVHLFQVLALVCFVTYYITSVEDKLRSLREISSNDGYNSVARKGASYSSGLDVEHEAARLVVATESKDDETKQLYTPAAGAFNEVATDSTFEESNSIMVGLRKKRIGDGRTTSSSDQKPSKKPSYPRHVDPGLKKLMTRSKSLQAEPFNITTAICHKTIFGTINLSAFIDWAVYNHMLGFDHIFVSYLPDIKDKDGFDELVSLPYVTAWENTRGYIEKQTSDLDDSVKEQLWTQHKLEEKCLKELAVDYDWVMNADADEYLWFNQSMGVKEFLTKMDEQHYDYISLGKWFYSPGIKDKEVDVASTGNDSGFYLSDYPFTTGPHCGRVKGPAPDVCFGGAGRCKTIVKPSQHFKVHVHGTHDPDTREMSLQMPSAWGHFKEWPSVNTPASEKDYVHPPHNFWVKSSAQARMVKVGSFFADPLKGAQLHYDGNLSTWFDYVAQRRLEGA